MEVIRGEFSKHVGRGVEVRGGGPSFQEVIAEAKNMLSFENGTAVEKALPAIQRPYADLLRMQIRIARQAVTVELASKAADSAAAIFRRLQQG